MSVPGAASVPAVDPRNNDIAHSSGKLLYNLIEKDIKPRDIMTREAFENAITVVLSMGGSTNAVLHLLAIAHDAEVPLSAFLAVEPGLDSYVGHERLEFGVEPCPESGDMQPGI